ncbi:MAG: type I-E CRISPR-associated protein Cse2/CasB [Phototrophicaceae bacterium]
MTTETEERRHPFVSYLEGLVDDRAALAELRRGLGREPGEAPGMYPYVMPFVRNSYDEDDYYLIAALFGLHPSSGARGNMGEHLYAYAQALGDDAATTRRFTQLLRQRRATLDTPLRQHIAMLKSKDIPVNFHQLMLDLRGWDHDEKYVQKRWASAYWKYEPSKSNR